MKRTRWRFIVSMSAWVISAGCAASDRDAEPPIEEPLPSVRAVLPVNGGVAPAVLALAPSEGETPTVPTESVVMDQFALAFVPEFLVVVVGQTVSFTNSEIAEHNVRLVLAESAWRQCARTAPRRTVPRPGTYDRELPGRFAMGQCRAASQGRYRSIGTRCRCLRCEPRAARTRAAPNRRSG